MSVRAALLWASLGLTTVGASLAAVELSRRRIARYIREIAAVIGFIMIIWFGVYALFLSPLTDLFGFSPSRPFTNPPLRWTEWLVAVIGFAVNGLQVRFVWHAIMSPVRKKRSKLGVSLELAVIMVTVALVPMLVHQGSHYPHPLVRAIHFAFVGSYALGFLTCFFFSMSEWIRVVLATRMSVALWSLILGFSGSFLRTVVALGLWGLNK